MPRGFDDAGDQRDRVKPPEPDFAERARTLVHVAKVGSLCTIARQPPGAPFGSVAPFGADSTGRPTFLLSRLAVHTQNLLADPRASLLVTEPGWTNDPLEGARATLIGKIAPAADDEATPIKTEYLSRHPNSQLWAGFGDFGFYRLDVSAVYYVAGFGSMGWVKGPEYTEAEPDPLADVAAGILAHMNADHATALVDYCRAFAGVEADAAVMIDVDRLGFRVRIARGEDSSILRIGFTREVRSAANVRAVLVEMARQARAKSSDLTQS